MSRDATEDGASSSPAPLPDGWLDLAVEAFVRAWREGEPRPIEAFLAEAPEGGSEPLCQRLVAEELRLRLGSGETPDGDEYRRRFPDFSGSIAELLEALFSTRAGSVTPVGDETTLLLPSRPGPTRDWSGRVLGDYRVIGPIGGGGMGAVYRAHHTYLDREVAVKVVLPDRQESRSSVERFFREMKAVGRLDHPNIVRSHDAREVEGVPFLVMELLQGRDLQRLVTERGPLPVPVACELIYQAALGLAHAHGKGLVHRDVKPSNLFLTDSGVLKVLDLGLSLLHIGDAEAGEDAHSIGSGLTLEGQALGTPDYMAPEQWNDALNADGRADLYGLGATLYFLLSGRPPFIGQGYSTYHGKMRGHLNDTPPALCSLRPEVPIALAAVVDRALSKAPGDRQATADEFASAVATFVGRVDLAGWLAAASQRRTERPDDETSVATVHPAPGTSGPRQVDEDVQFTVYRPKAVLPEEWRPLLVFAHLAERRPDAPADEPDPVAEVRRQAEQVLGAAVDRFQPTTQESVESVPRGDTLTFIPQAAGVEFNPPSRSFAWVESVHREEFRFKASRELDGQTARGRVTVYLGQMILAEIPIKVRVDAAHVEPADEPLEPATGRRFRRIYASFAADDRPIAEEFEGFARLMGDEYTLGCASLRLVDVWDDRVRKRIAEADVFQLFWSSRALSSPQVEREWQYALGLNRPDFIRPVYWEDPLPADPARDLPPDALKVCEFQRLVRAEAPAAEAPAESVEETRPIGGRYRLGESLGARRWKAEDLKLLRTVLVEAIGPEVGRNLAAMGSLRRDFQKLATLRCPAVPRCLDLLTEEDTTYLVQEYVVGERLSESLRRRGALDADDALPIVLEICRAIDAAHAAGVVHGDLKPHNVILAGPGGQWKVVGLGREALRRGRSSQAMTVYQPPAVSIPHAAPEVMMGDPASPAGDVFSIGAILFEALTGGPLATSPIERMQAFQKPIPRIRERNPSARVPRAVEDAVLRCLQYDPSKRYASAAELMDALGRDSEALEPLAVAHRGPVRGAERSSVHEMDLSPRRTAHGPVAAMQTPSAWDESGSPPRPAAFEPPAGEQHFAASRGRRGWPVALVLIALLVLGLPFAFRGLKDWFGRTMTHVASPVGQDKKP